MKEEPITILLTGPGASRKKVLRGLTKKKAPGYKGPFSAAARTYTYMEHPYLVSEMPDICPSDLQAPSTGRPAVCPSDLLTPGIDLPAACPSDLLAPGIDLPAACPSDLQDPGVSQDRHPSPASPPFAARVHMIVIVCDALFLEQGLDRLDRLTRLDPVRENGLPLLLCVCGCRDARAQGVWTDYDLLEDVLQIPVLSWDGEEPSGADDVKAAIAYAWKRHFSYDCLDFSPKKLAKETTHYTKTAYGLLEDKVDRLLARPVAGNIILVLYFLLLTLPALAGTALLFGSFKGSLHWLTGPLSTGLVFLSEVFHIPSWFIDLLVQGILSPLACVLTVLLPPMALCLPLFCFLEEAGLLPRAAFAADKAFKPWGGCGQQCLAMSMGFCCRQAGIWGCWSCQPAGDGGGRSRLPARDGEGRSCQPAGDGGGRSCLPAGTSGMGGRSGDAVQQTSGTGDMGMRTKEKMASLLTISFLPCCGQLPALLTFSFLLSSGRGLLFSAFFLAVLILLGLAAALCSTFLLTRTALHRFPSLFLLVLPPIRMPLLKRVIPTAFDRTCLLLGRAASMAVLAGLLRWAMANLFIQGASLLSMCTTVLDPLGRLLGLDGTILAAFLLSAPADELMLPTMLMLYQEMDVRLPIGSFADLARLLTANGWTWQTALSASLFTLFHWPCASTLAAIRRETGKLRWALAAFFLPTLWGTLLCAGLSLLARGTLLP